MLLRHQQLCFIVLLPILNAFTLSDTTAGIEEIRFKYNVTINPADGIDNETCYPPEEGGISTVSCKSLNFALKIHHHSNIVFYLANPNSIYYLDTDLVTFSNGSTIGFIGASTFYPLQAEIHCHGDNVSLSFLNYDTIVFDMVQFVYCGAWHDSTSLDMTKRQQLLKIRAALYFYNCTDVAMNHVQVLKSSQAIAVVMYNVDGIIDINKCNFSTNMVSENSYGGGGFAVEFTYCKPGDETCSDENYDPDEPRRNKDALYKFTNCTFQNNEAHAQKGSTYGGYVVVSSNSSHEAMGRGGGLSVFFKGDAFNNSIFFVNCTFSNNRAVDGGGLFVKMSDNTIANTVSVLGCHFFCNQAYFTHQFGTGGGGLSFSTRIFPWSYDDTNTLYSGIYIDKCNFTGNHALSGGGMLSSISRQISQPLEIVISDTSFESNKAEIGSAIAQYLFSVFSNGHVPQVIIDSCSFIRNSLSYVNETIHLAGIGIVYIRQVPTAFRGYTNFIANKGSALSVIGTQVNFTGAKVDFLENKGLLGAGIALLGCASVLVGDNATINFFDNHAMQYGGAIYNQDINQDSDTYECFIQYSIPFVNPQRWNVSFKFINNTAEKLGNAIYSTDILHCSHGFGEVQDIFCWDLWDYGYANCTDQIYTKAHTLNTTATSTNPVKVYPGHTALLPLESLDDFDHNVTSNSVYLAYIHNNFRSIAEVEPGYSHVASNYISITGEPEHNLTLVMQTESIPILQVKLSLEVRKCPPGFILHSPYSNSTMVGSKSYCRCPMNSSEDYLGLLKCLQRDFQSQIPARMWLGEVKMEKNLTNLLMGAIPLAYSYTENASYKNILSDSEQLNDRLCGPVHRTGDLCGKCLPGYAVAVNSANFVCVPCNNTNTAEFVRKLFAYIGLTYGPVVLLFLMIIFFNIKLSSSASMGFILYAQMIGSGIFSLYPAVCVDCPKRTILTAYETIYGIFNLNSLASLMNPFCLNEHFGTLDVLCLDYAIAGFPLLMIILIYLILRCTSRFDCHRIDSSTARGKDKNKAGRNTLLHAFISFVLLSYTKFSLASTRTIVQSNLFDLTGETKHKRVYFAGHLTFDNPDFLFPYGILAIFFLIFVVILSPLLLLGPLLIDWMIDQKQFGFLRRVWPSIKVHTFLDTFQGYYKPNRRIFSSTFFFFRIAVFFSYSFSTKYIQTYVIQQIAVTILIVIIAIFRPYKKDYYNSIDILLFMNLSILNALGIYVSVNSDPYLSHHVYAVECTLVWLPLVYIIVYAVWNRLQKKQVYHKWKRSILMRSFVRFTRVEGMKNEREELLKQEESENSDSDDPDEDLFRRAAQRNAYRHDTKISN